eukprot:GHVH01003304.1.p1 GENE.GHVH01003304.1~~GHVH01003304.1.p1  ORF type:complete len:400 (+),score=35.95 GHVH01003304.1:443-1642(+)
MRARPGVQIELAACLWTPTSERLAHRSAGALELFNYVSEKGKTCESVVVRSRYSQLQYHLNCTSTASRNVFSVTLEGDESSFGRLSISDDDFVQLIPTSVDLWYLVRDFEMDHHKSCHLNEGDLIRIGRCTFEVTLIGTDSSSASMTRVMSLLEEDVDDEALPPELPDIDMDDDNICCRVCLDDSNDVHMNPLLHLCLCRGGIGVLHFDCIRQWLAAMSVIRKDKHIRSSIWKTKVCCELCQCSYPRTIQSKHILGNKPSKLIGSPLSVCLLPEVPFIALKCPETGSIKFLALSESEPTTIGRDPTNAMVISEDSVSRKHARLGIDRDDNQMIKVVIEDCFSKYGTAIQVVRPFTFNSHLPIWFQVRNCVFMVEVGKLSWFRRWISLGKDIQVSHATEE